MTASATKSRGLRYRARIAAACVPFALAVLALLVGIAVPPGYMPSEPAAGQGFQIVICTGHGPLQFDVSGEHKAPPGKPKPDTACPYAIGPAVPPLPPLVSVAPRAGTFEKPVSAAVENQTRGRGLAAPPPPAQAPPSLQLRLNG